ncbi:hypothetical protein JYU14_00400 [Simkania negevensis]|uniref:Penicillin-binding protein n=1 Tax=Simkania negevensis TaxID=83561 RepID=A0ABS3APF7_9BACT|nr:hypothetical protein [Simkania negevensis]
MNVILIAMILIALRTWYLGVVQHDDGIEKARLPQKRVLISRAPRATIEDRFGEPLAINQVQYNASISYAQIREIPSVVWRKDDEGKKVKEYQRREHIQNLSQMLGETLSMDSERIEDLIHAKAAFFPHTPYVIKEDISEKEFFRLKLLEKDWLGLQPERVSKRFYPKGRSASSVIGYLGAINSREYQAITREVNLLEEVLKAESNTSPLPLPKGYRTTEEVEKRLNELKERAYTFNDLIGKAGIEAEYDEELKGFRGKMTYLCDAQGRFWKELPGAYDPIGGKKLTLTISSELQEYVEQLLAENEKLREGRSFKYTRQGLIKMQQPWIKGGAVVALDPNTGEVLALASHPRYNPNDLLPASNPEEKESRNRTVAKWYELNSHIEAIWDQQISLEKEFYSPAYGGFYDVSESLSWQSYLSFILPPTNQIRQQFEKRATTVGDAVAAQMAFDSLSAMAGGSHKPLFLIEALYEGEEEEGGEREQIRHELLQYGSHYTRAKQTLDSYVKEIQHNKDKLLFLDLCRIAVNGEAISEPLLKQIANNSLSNYRNSCCAIAKVKTFTYKETKTLFHQLDFERWRSTNQKAFLKGKRKEEDRQKRYHKPYIDHLDQEERRQLNAFWRDHFSLLTNALVLGIRPKSNDTSPQLEPYLQHFLAWHNELEQGAHHALEWAPSYQLLSQAAKTLPSPLAKEYLSSLRNYSELTRPLLGRYRGLRREEGGEYIEKNLAAAFYPLYGFSYMRSYAFRQATTIGSIFKLTTAYEALRQRYDDLVNDDQSIQHNLNPLTIVDKLERSHSRINKWNVAYRMNGEAIPQLYRGGRLPRSSSRNIGKVDLTEALATSSNPFFSLLALEHLQNPQDLVEAAKAFSFGAATHIDLPGEYAGILPDDVSYNITGLYAFAIGQHSFVVTPLQTAVMIAAIANQGKILQPVLLKNDLKEQQLPIVRQELFLPKEIREALLEGMYQSIHSDRGTGRKEHIRSYPSRSAVMQAFDAVSNDTVGKTSTAEIVKRVNLDRVIGTTIYKDVGFSAISFERKEGVETSYRPQYDKPELVVVVFLPFADYGKEAAPIALATINKWREIKAKQQ